MKRYIGTILKILMFFVLWTVGILICSLPVLDKPLFFRNNEATLRLWWELTPMVATLLVNFIFIKIIDKGKIKIHVFGNVLKDSVFGIIAGCVWIGVTFFILTAIGSFHLGSKNTSTYIWIWILAGILNVIMQEFFVRGYLFQILKEKVNTTFSIVITTVIFTAMHGGAFEVGVVPVLNVMTMSVFVSLLLIYTKNLLAPIIVHAIWNIVGGIVLGGVALGDDYPRIWNSTLSGNSLISGGAAKMEGSIVVLAINLILITTMAILIAKQYRKNMVFTKQLNI